MEFSVSLPQPRTLAVSSFKAAVAVWLVQKQQADCALLRAGRWGLGLRPHGRTQQTFCVRFYIQFTCGSWTEEDEASTYASLYEVSFYKTWAFEPEQLWKWPYEGKGFFAHPRARPVGWTVPDVQSCGALLLLHLQPSEQNIPVVPIKRVGKEETRKAQIVRDCSF